MQRGVINEGDHQRRETSSNSGEKEIERRGGGMECICKGRRVGVNVKGRDGNQRQETCYQWQRSFIFIYQDISDL